MNWITASEYLKSKIKKVGTHGGRTIGAHVFYVGRDKYLVYDSRKIDRFNIRNEYQETIEEQEKEQVEEVLVARIGKGKKLHKAIKTSHGIATACNPEKTEYGGVPVREATGFGLQDIDCLVCLQTKGKTK